MFAWRDRHVRVAQILIDGQDVFRICKVGMFGPFCFNESQLRARVDDKIDLSGTLVTVKPQVRAQGGVGIPQ